MKKQCSTCVFFRAEKERHGDGWCTENYDATFDNWDGCEPNEVWCSAWKSAKRWAEIYKRNGEIQTLKAMHRRIASLLAIGSESALRHAAAIAKEHGGEA